jgi:hypothetical protein
MSTSMQAIRRVASKPTSAQIHNASSSISRPFRSQTYSTDANSSSKSSQDNQVVSIYTIASSTVDYELMRTLEINHQAHRRNPECAQENPSRTRQGARAEDARSRWRWRRIRSGARGWTAHSHEKKRAQQHVSIHLVGGAPSTRSTNEQVYKRNTTTFLRKGFQKWRTKIKLTCKAHIYPPEDTFGSTTDSRLVLSQYDVLHNLPLRRVSTSPCLIGRNITAIKNYCNQDFSIIKLHYDCYRLVYTLHFTSIITAPQSPPRSSHPSYFATPSFPPSLPHPSPMPSSHNSPFPKSNSQSRSPIPPTHQ